MLQNCSLRCNRQLSTTGTRKSGTTALRRQGLGASATNLEWAGSLRSFGARGHSWGATMPDPPRRAGVEFPPLERQGAGAAPRGGCFPARGSIHPRPLRQGRLLASRAATAARCCFCCCGGGGGGGASSRRCSSDNPSGLDPPASSAVSIRVLPRGIPPAGSTPGVGWPLAWAPVRA